MIPLGTGPPPNSAELDSTIFVASARVPDISIPYPAPAATQTVSTEASVFTAASPDDTWAWLGAKPKVPVSFTPSSQEPWSVVSAQGRGDLRSRLTKMHRYTSLFTLAPQRRDTSPAPLPARCGSSPLNRLGFIDNCNLFGSGLEAANGIHPSRLGSRALAANIQHAVQCTTSTRD